MALVSVAAAVPLIGASTTAEAKARKAAVHYRDYPSGMQHVPHVQVLYRGEAAGASGGMCMGGSMMGMMGAGACQVVEGRISPMGYCDLYVAA